MAAIYSNGGNRWNILGFNFTKRDALSSVYKISMVRTLAFVPDCRVGQFSTRSWVRIRPHLRCGCAKLPKNTQVRLLKCSMKKLKGLKGLRGTFRT